METRERGEGSPDGSDQTDESGERDMQEPTEPEDIDAVRAAEKELAGKLGAMGPGRSG